MITAQNFIDAFGTKTNAAKQIGTSRVTIDAWISQGYISKECRHGIAAGTDWHDRIKKLGFSPTTLLPL